MGSRDKGSFCVVSSKLGGEKGWLKRQLPSLGRLGRISSKTHFVVYRLCDPRQVSLSDASVRGSLLLPLYSSGLRAVRPHQMRSEVGRGGSGLLPGLPTYFVHPHILLRPRPADRGPSVLPTLQPLPHRSLKPPRSKAQARGRGAGSLPASRAHGDLGWLGQHPNSLHLRGAQGLAFVHPAPCVAPTVC